MKKRRSEKLILEIDTIFKDQSPLQMAAALFEASRTSQFVRDGLTELLPHVYEPSQDNAVARDMIEPISILITCIRLEGCTDQTLSTIQAKITSLVHTPEKGTQLPKKTDGTLFSPMTTSPRQIPYQHQIVYAMPTPPPCGRTLTSTTISRMRNQTTATAPSLPAPTKAFARLLGVKYRTMRNWVNNALKCRFENKHHGTSIFLWSKCRCLKVNRSGWLAIRAFIRSHESVSPSPNTKETLLFVDDDGKTKVRKTKLVMNEPVQSLHNSFHVEVILDSTRPDSKRRYKMLFDEVTRVHRFRYHVLHLYPRRSQKSHCTS
jgi:hypothetical protein